MKPVRIGCSGWAYKEWRGDFYPSKLPQREWLRRYVTHIKRLLNPEKYTERFFDAIGPIAEAGKLASVLRQLPPSFKLDLERLGALLDTVAPRPARFAFEFRHASWFVPETYELLRSHGAALVIGDDPDLAFRASEITAGWTYLRFHRGLSSADAPSRELETWRRRIASWRSKTEVLAYFNNTSGAAATVDALQLHRSFV